MPTRFLFLATGLIAVLAGCAPPVDRVPEPVQFQVGGSNYTWSLAHGITGSLSLNRTGGTGRGLPEVIMTCDGTTTGSLQIRDEKAATGPLSVAAGSKTFTVPSTDERGDPKAFSGEGAFQPGWFDALSLAETVTVGYGDEAFEVRGPGESAVGHYRRYCEKLDRRNRAS